MRARVGKVFTTFGVLAILGVASALAGCANVLGIGDFTVLDDGGDSSVGPAQGSEGGMEADATALPDATEGGAADRADAGDAADATKDGDATSSEATAPNDAADASDSNNAADAVDAGNSNDAADAGGQGDDGGDSSSCVAGGSCTPAECQVGQYTCDGGGLTCGSVQSVTNGTSCGAGDAGDSGSTGSVCNQGVCTPCNSGGDCSVANSCKSSAYVCTTGTAVCTQVGNANDGTPCGSGMVCAGGVCTACMVGNACTPTNKCHNGTITSCAGGVATCTDMMTAASNGTSCGTNQVCNAGVCSNCAANVACTPTNACHTGTTSCATGVSVCTDTGGSQTNGTSCTDTTNLCFKTYTCQGGMCTGGSAVTCSAMDACHTVGTCDPTTGMCSNPNATNGTTCPTGTNLCFKTYTCQGGMCTGSSAVNCTASDACHTAGTCDPTTGVCSNPNATNGTTCTGSDACFQTYTCQSGTCTGSNPMSCPGGQVCQSGSCMCPTGTTNCGGTCVTLSTNGGNCGRCGHSCQGGMCTGSMCQVATFTTLGTTVADLASDGTVVVWTDSGDNAVYQVSSLGGSRIVLGSSGQGVSNPTNIAIDGSGTVFFLNFSGSQIGCATRVPSGGTPGTPSSNALGVGVIIPSSAHGLVPTGGGGAWFLISTANTYQTSCGATVSMGGGAGSGNGTSGRTIVAYSNGLVFGDVGGSNLDIIGAGGSLASIPGQAGVDYVATDGTYAYWATSTPSISRALLTSTTVLPVISSTFNAIQGLATDGTNVYFATVNGIFYAPVGGGAASSLTTTSGNFLKYVSGAVYFASGGTIYRIATP